MSKILAFCDYLSHQKRYSDHTIIAYKKDLEQFCRYLLFQYEISDISEATHPIIQSWMVQLLEENTSPRSIHSSASFGSVISMVALPFASVITLWLRKSSLIWLRILDPDPPGDPGRKFGVI